MLPWGIMNSRTLYVTCRKFSSMGRKGDCHGDVWGHYQDSLNLSEQFTFVRESLGISKSYDCDNQYARGYFCINLYTALVSFSVSPLTCEEAQWKLSTKHEIYKSPQDCLAVPH